MLFFKQFIITLMLAAFMAATSFIFISISSISLTPITSASQILLNQEGEVIAYNLSSDNQTYRFITEKKDVDELYLKMLIANEDKNFYSHFGVDLKALLRAFISNCKAERITSGGSTIAMQVVKKLSDHKQRTYLNKLKEIIGAVYITMRYGRDTVLKWYLTTAPFGSNIEGVKAASLKWFGHLPDKLTPSEAALLCALPRAPELIRPDRHYKNALFYKNEVLKLAYRNRVISKEILKNSNDEIIPKKIIDLRQDALTLGNYLFTKTEKKQIRTFIRKDITEILKTTAAFYEKTRKSPAVLSVVVLNSKSGNLEGILGSSDSARFQICLPFYKRSPGSALKPFAYALAFDEGKLHPQTILHDNQKMYGSWIPHNIDYKYKGETDAQTALRYSLNIPAIEVLNLIGSDYFVKKINTGKKRLFTAQNQNDLSIILGSGGITLFELTKLYAMLNNDGIINDFRISVDQISEESHRLLNKAAARVTFDILKKTPKPLNYPDNTQISYKTGTSHRFKDALAIGSIGEYTVGVSLSYPDNMTAEYKISGYKDAAPILFDIATALPSEKYYKEQIKDPLFEDLPPLALRKINDGIRSDAITNRLKIVFPQNNSIVSPDLNNRIFIKYTGGKGKIYTNFNDQQSDTNEITVTKDGFYTVCIFDEKAQSDCSNFQVKFNN